MAHVGEFVEPADIVARAPKTRRPELIDIAKELSIPPEQAGEYIQVETGTMVRTGEVIAAKKGPLGVLGKSWRARFDAVVVAVARGKVLLKPQATGASEQVDLPALLRGQVVGVLPERGVVIEAEAGLVQGIWGCGDASTGVLKVLVDSPDEPLTTASLDASSQGRIVVAGMLHDQTALRRAAEVKVGGIVAGSIRANLAAQKLRVPFPIVITEGFGTLPMARLIFDLLRGYEQEMAYVSGSWHNPPLQMLPEVIIFPAARGQAAPLEENNVIGPGVIVRITREPYLGRMGVVRSIGEKHQIIESGILTQCAEVELDDRQRVWTPVANLEKIQWVSEGKTR